MADQTRAKQLALGREANYQVEALLCALLRAANETRVDDPLVWLVRAAAPRVIRLNAVALGAMDGEAMTVEDMTEALDQTPFGAGASR